MMVFFNSKIQKQLSEHQQSLYAVGGGGQQGLVFGQVHRSDDQGANKGRTGESLSFKHLLTLLTKKLWSTNVRY